MLKFTEVTSDLDPILTKQFGAGNIFVKMEYADGGPIFCLGRASNDDVSKFNCIMDPVNDYLNTLKPETQEEIAMALVAMNNRILGLESENFDFPAHIQRNAKNIINFICTTIYQLIQKSKIMDTLPAYSYEILGKYREDVLMPPALRVQNDASEMYLIAMAILSKLMAPITLSFAAAIQHNHILDTGKKTINLASIILNAGHMRIAAPLFDLVGTIYAEEMTKFPTYSYPSLDAVTGTFSTRRLATYNFNRTDGNIFVYLTTCVRLQLITQRKSVLESIR